MRSEPGCQAGAFLSAPIGPEKAVIFLVYCLQPSEIIANMESERWAVLTLREIKIDN